MMDKVIQHFGKGETIFPEGTKGDRIYRIISGEVLICKKGVQGKTIPITKLGEGEIFGEMYLFDGSGSRSASVVAASDLKVEVYFEDEIQAELINAPPEVQQMLTSFTNRLKNTTGNFASLFKEKMIVELPDGTMKVVDGQ
ncbi:cyclic nucleotide-binding domain-containing protein [Vampirovibrio sp.]|uniref:cyclic nucleotide-binding domain-containing protein n=1 Tax=Vampirovibrio sp. TaxID=2717857 RepID=UPI003593D1D2